MIEEGFHVSRTVGEGHSRAADVVRLRKALKKTGHSRPAPQPSGTYDRSVQDAVMRFQHDFGLKEDGIVRPGGPTQAAINIAHAALEAGEREGYEAVRQPFAVLHRAGFRSERDGDDPHALTRWVDSEGRRVAPQQIRNLLRGRDGSGHQLAMRRNRDPITGQPIPPGVRHWGGILEGGSGGGGGRGTVRGGDVLKGLFRQMFGDEEKEPGQERTSPNSSEPARRSAPLDNPPKPLPPSPTEPPPEPRKGQERLEPDEKRALVLPGPKPVEVRPGVLVFPDLSEEFNRLEIVEDRKGTPETRDHLERVRDWFLTPERKAEGWEHVAGGRKQDDGSELEEKAIPNPLKDFEGEHIPGTVDGRKGSKFPDLTFYNKHTKKWVFIQTVDFRNGRPTQREEDNAWAIRQRTGGQVFLVPKPTRR